MRLLSVRELFTRPDNLFISKTYRKLGKNWLLPVFLWPVQMHCTTPSHKHSHTNTNTSTLNNYVRFLDLEWEALWPDISTGTKQSATRAARVFNHWIVSLLHVHLYYRFTNVRLRLWHSQEHHSWGCCPITCKHTCYINYLNCMKRRPRISYWWKINMIFH